jgi:hypothetical protein
MEIQADPTRGSQSNKRGANKLVGISGWKLASQCTGGEDTTTRGVADRWRLPHGSSACSWTRQSTSRSADVAAAGRGREPRGNTAGSSVVSTSFLRGCTHFQRRDDSDAAFTHPLAGDVRSGSAPLRDRPVEDNHAEVPRELLAGEALDLRERAVVRRVQIGRLQQDAAPLPTGATGLEQLAEVEERKEGEEGITEERRGRYGSGRTRWSGRLCIGCRCLLLVG